MNIIAALKNGAILLSKTWKNLVLIWFVMLLVTTIFVSPLKGILYSGFDNSMITEKFADGIYLEGLLDSGNILEGLASGMITGLFTLIVFNFLLNAFFTGGLFEIMRSDCTDHSVRNFLRGCAAQFWSYLGILLIASIIIFFSMVLVMAIPFLFLKSGDSMETSIMRAVVISVILYALSMPVMLLIADYARAWKAANDTAGVWKSIGKGFSLTFSAFFSSWILMFILLIINSLYLLLMMSFLAGLTPDTGLGVFLLFLFSQLTYFVRIILKSYRYGSVSSLMESLTFREIAPQI